MQLSAEIHPPACVLAFRRFRHTNWLFIARSDTTHAWRNRDMSPLVLTRDEEELIQCCRSLAQVSLVSVTTYRVVLRCLQVMAYLATNFPSRVGDGIS